MVCCGLPLRPREKPRTCDSSSFSLILSKGRGGVRRESVSRTSFTKVSLHDDVKSWRNPVSLPKRRKRPVWSCYRDGKSNCSIETQRCVFGQHAVLKKVTSAQCSECEGEVVLSSTGKRRE